MRVGRGLCWNRRSSRGDYGRRRSRRRLRWRRLTGLRARNARFYFRNARMRRRFIMCCGRLRRGVLRFRLDLRAGGRMRSFPRRVRRDLWRLRWGNWFCGRRRRFWRRSRFCILLWMRNEKDEPQRRRGRRESQKILHRGNRGKAEDTETERESLRTAWGKGAGLRMTMLVAAAPRSESRAKYKLFGYS